MRNIVYHEYFASSPGIDWNVLVGEAKRDAAWHYGVDAKEWRLEGMYEYDNEVYDERGRLLDIEARIVVKWVDPLH